MQTVFLASWAIPVCAPPLEHAFVSVEDDRVVAWGPVRDRPRGRDVREVDLGNGVLMPGFVNAHTHLELSHLSGVVSGSHGFVPWIEEQLRVRAERAAMGVEAAVEDAIRALTAGGTVAVTDISNTLSTIGALVESSLHALVLHEILGWDPAKIDVVLANAATQRISASRALKSSRVRLGVAAHAPHSVAPGLARALAADGGVKSIHLAESSAEVDFLRDGTGQWPAFLEARVGSVPFKPPGLSPVLYAAELGLLREGVLAVHCVHVDDVDASVLADARAVAVLCPRSNEYLGNGVPPLERLLAAGVSVALGTDSLASCASLDVLDDARFLARRFPRVAAARIVEALTRNGAQALDFDDLGELAPRRMAQFAFVAAAGESPRDPIAFLLHDDAPAGRVSAT